MAEATPHNYGTVMLLAILPALFGINGCGHIYMGRVGRGVALLIGSWVVYGFFIGMLFGAGVFDDPSELGHGGLLILAVAVIALTFFIYQLVDARALCREYNAHVEEYGKKPDDW